MDQSLRGRASGGTGAGKGGDRRQDGVDLPYSEDKSRAMS
jgi:hypothetical protein